MPVLIDRNVTVTNYLNRMPRIPPLPGHPWEGLPGYTLHELQTIEGMLRSEITHLHQGLTQHTLLMPEAVARARKALLTDQLAGVRAIRRIMYPTGWQPSRDETGAPSPPRRLYKYANHLARMFHRWQLSDDDDAAWEEVMRAYDRIPHELLESREWESPEAPGEP